MLVLEQPAHCYLLAVVIEARIVVHIIVFWHVLLSKGDAVKLCEEGTSDEEDV